MNIPNRKNKEKKRNYELVIQWNGLLRTVNWLSRGSAQLDRNYQIGNNYTLLYNTL